MVFRRGHLVSAIIGAVLFGITAIAFTVLFIFATPDISDTFEFFGLLAIVVGCWFALIAWIVDFRTSKVTIDASGIEYKTFRKHYFIPWNKLQTVGKAYIPHQGNRGAPLIYFNAESAENFKIISEKMKSENFFYLYYRDAVWEEVQKYWVGELSDIWGPEEFNPVQKEKLGKIFTGWGIFFIFLWIVIMIIVNHFGVMERVPAQVVEIGLTGFIATDSETVRNNLKRVEFTFNGNLYSGKLINFRYLEVGDTTDIYVNSENPERIRHPDSPIPWIIILVIVLGISVALIAYGRSLIKEGRRLQECSSNL